MRGAGNTDQRLATIIRDRLVTYRASQQYSEGKACNLHKPMQAGFFRCPGRGGRSSTGPVCLLRMRESAQMQHTFKDKVFRNLS